MFKTKIQILSIVIVSLLMVSVASASAPVNIAVKALSQKLKNDLAVSSVNLKLENVVTRNISRQEVQIKGTGAANDLPINFTVKVDKFKAVPTDVAYVFVDSPAPTAAADTEDVLTRDLLVQLNKDYKTENIVVSIDGFDQSQTGSAKNFKGSGDVRVGFDWSKIDFEITLDANNKPAAVKYQIKN